MFLGHAPVPLEVNRSMSESLLCWENSNCLALKSKVNIFFFFEEVKTVTSIFFSSVENNCVTKAALIKQKTSEICLILSNHTFFIYVTKWIKSVIH